MLCIASKALMDVPSRDASLDQKLLPRSYQLAIFEAARQRNVSDSGKTSALCRQLIDFFIYQQAQLIHTEKFMLPYRS